MHKIDLICDEWEVLFKNLEAYYEEEELDLDLFKKAVLDAFEYFKLIRSSIPGTKEYSFKCRECQLLSIIYAYGKVEPFFPGGYEYNEYILASHLISVVLYDTILYGEFSSSSEISDEISYYIEKDECLEIVYNVETGDLSDCVKIAKELINDWKTTGVSRERIYSGGFHL